MNQFTKWTLVVSTVLSFSISADELTLKDGHPTTYVVKKGDTLWDISEHFLHSPWLWPKLWQSNPQVEDPHLIYPGERLHLVYVDGQPQLTRKRILHLSPEARKKDKGAPVPTISLELIAPFLSRDFVSTDGDVEKAPQILGNNDGMKSFAAGHTLYATGGLKSPLYGIYRPKRDLFDPATEEFLGLEIEFLGSAELDFSGSENQPAKLKIKSSYLNARIGDLLMPIPELDELPAYFTPRAGRLADKDGRIVAARNEQGTAGKYNIVILNVGERDEVAAGDMFAIQLEGEFVERHGNNYHYENHSTAYERTFSGKDAYQLPDETVGQLMVFKAYEKTSLALITRSQSLIRVNDKLTELD